MLKTQTDYITIALQGQLSTNTQGIRQLLNWYSEASLYRNTTIYTCCKDLEWLDANLAALWSALIYRLKHENNLLIVMDEPSLQKRFSILIRNGFSSASIYTKDAQASFIRNACFSVADEKLFSDYVEAELMQQRQIKNLAPELKNLLENNLYELFTNVYKHAKTQYPFFVCGQYYPNRNELVVSIVDLGQTFLPPIHKQTEGKITKQAEAIDWALQGNSELGEEGGGHALKGIKKYFEKNGHALQIVTGDAFFDSGYCKTMLGSHRNLPREMPGTMVSFILNIDRR